MFDFIALSIQQEEFPSPNNVGFEFSYFMFQWLKDVYLNFINGWKAESEQIENISKEMKSRLCLSYQTIEGIRIASKETSIKSVCIDFCLCECKLLNSLWRWTRNRVLRYFLAFTVKHHVENPWTLLDEPKPSLTCVQPKNSRGT